MAVITRQVDLENVKLRSVVFSKVHFDQCKDKWDQECATEHQFLDISTVKSITFSKTWMNFKDLQEPEWGIDIKEAESVNFDTCKLTELRKRSIRARSKRVTFLSSDLTSVESGAIVIIGAENVTFNLSTVDRLYEEGIQATSNNVNLLDSHFKNTQRRALIGLVGIQDSSVLFLQNLHLYDPARGALITKFHTGMNY